MFESEKVGPANFRSSSVRSLTSRADSPAYLLRVDRQLMDKRGRPRDSEDAKEYNSFDSMSHLIAEAEGTLF